MNRNGPVLHQINNCKQNSLSPPPTSPLTLLTCALRIISMVRMLVINHSLIDYFLIVKVKAKITIGKIMEDNFFLFWSTK